MSILQELHDFNALLSRLLILSDDSLSAQLEEGVTPITDDAAEVRTAFALFAIESSVRALRERLNVPIEGAFSAQHSLGIDSAHSSEAPPV